MKRRSKAVRLASLVLAFALFIMPVQALAFDDLDGEIVIDDGGSGDTDAGDGGGDTAGSTGDDGDIDSGDKTSEEPGGEGDPNSPEQGIDPNNPELPEIPGDPNTPSGGSGSTGSGGGGVAGAVGTGGTVGALGDPIASPFDEKPTSREALEALVNEAVAEERETIDAKWETPLSGEELDWIPEGWKQTSDTMDGEDGPVPYWTLTKEVVVVTPPEKEVNDLGELTALLAEGNATAIQLNAPIAITSTEDAAAIASGKEVTLTVAADMQRHFVILGDNIVLDLTNITLDGENKGGGIEFGQDVTNFTLKYAVIKNTKAVRGAALLSWDKKVTGTLTIADSHFIDNASSSSDGGAVLVEAADTLDISDSTFSGNASAYHGGALYLNNIKNVAITGGEFSGNTAKYAGGAIYATKIGVLQQINYEDEANKEEKDRFGAKDCAFLVDGVTFSANKSFGSASGGGAIHVTESFTIGIEDSHFLNSNYAAYSGGAVYAYSNPTGHVFVQNSTFKNTDTGKNGALAIESKADGVTITDCEFYDNTAVENGGAINIFNAIHNVNIHRIRVERNIAGGNAGGLDYETNSHGTLTLTGSTFKDNQANGAAKIGSSRGGALFINIYHDNQTPRQSLITGSVFENNFSKQDGGAIMICNSVIEMTDCEVLDNKTDANGGGIALEKNEDKVRIGGSTKIESNIAALDGGGIFIPDEKVEYAWVGPEVIFEDNSAMSFALSLRIDDERNDLAIHGDQIETRHFSQLPGSESNDRFEYAYNNYDINYTRDIYPWYYWRISYVGNGGIIDIAEEPNRTVHVEYVDGHDTISPDGKTVTYKPVPIPKATVTKGNSEFLGWYTDKDGPNGTPWNFESDLATGHMTLYAHWEDDAPISDYNVVFYFNYLDAPNDIFAKDLVPADSPRAVKAPGAPSRTGYTFVDWYEVSNPTEDDKPYDMAQIVTGDLSLYAHWEKITYKVVFHYNHENAPTDDGIYRRETVDEGKPVVTVPDPSISGYSFLGWFEKDETVTPFDLNTPINGDLDLYARWEKDGGTINPPITKYTVVFHYNHDKSPTDDGIHLRLTVDEGKTVGTVSNPTIDGYTFLGWFEKDETVTPFDLNTPINGDLDLYARWSENDDNGGDGNGGRDRDRRRPPTDGGEGTFIPDTQTPLVTVTPDPGVIITDDDVPLEELPFTGASSLFMVRALGTACLAFAILPRKRRNEEDAA